MCKNSAEQALSLRVPGSIHDSDDSVHGCDSDSAFSFDAFDDEYSDFDVDY